MHQCEGKPHRVSREERGARNEERGHNINIIQIERPTGSPVLLLLEQGNEQGSEQARDGCYGHNQTKGTLGRRVDGAGESAAGAGRLSTRRHEREEDTMLLRGNL